ncbi:MAG TPA: DUF493 domain-containing protein [Gammaproteobacteria bacterium]
MTADTSPLTFPVEFPVKVMGHDTPDFHATLADIFARHVAPLDALKVSHQASREGRFISVTVIFTAESRAQLDALYTELSGNEHVLMTL